MTRTHTDHSRGDGHRSNAGGDRGAGRGSRRALLIVLLALILAAPTAGAAVVRVPSDYPRIAVALEAAGTGDTVLVAPGTYVETIEWPATASLKLIGEAGAAATIVDGDAKDSVIHIDTGVDTTTVIRGLTLRNGFAAGA